MAAVVWVMPPCHARHWVRRRIGKPHPVGRHRQADPMAWPAASACVMIRAMSNAAEKIDDDDETDRQLEEAVRIGLADTVLVDHEIVGEWLLALARGEKLPAPLP